jgi:hypothetical protein
VAAREDEAKTVVIDVAGLIRNGFVGSDFNTIGNRRQGSVEPHAAPQAIDSFETSGGNEPGSRISRDTFSGPNIEGRNECIVQRLLGEVKISQEANQSGEYPPRILAIHRIDLALQVMRLVFRH